MKKNSILFFVLLLFGTYIQAQVQGVLSSSASTCPNNGTITASASGGTNSPVQYIFTLIDGPRDNEQTYPIGPQYHQFNFTFQDLYPGNYTVKIEEAGNPDNTPFTDTIDVENEYEQLLLDLTGENPVCVGTASGKITANVPSGTGPFQYQIYDGPQGNQPTIASSNTSYTFSDLSAGTYTIRVYDSCNNYQTREFTLTDPNYPAIQLTNSGSPSVKKVSCTEANYKVGASGGTGFGTYTYEVTNPPTGYTGETSNSNGVFTLPIDGAPYNFKVTDTCGNEDTYTHDNPSAYLSYQVQNRSCEGWDLVFSPRWFFEDEENPITYTVTGNDGSSYSNNTGSFPNLAINVSYSLKAEDTCGTTRFSSTTINSEPLQIKEPETLNSITYDSCENGTAKFEIRYNNGSSGAVQPVYWEITNHPTSYTGEVGPSVSVQWDGLTVGTYTIKGTDSCNNIDEFTFEVTNDDALQLQVNATPIQGCENAGTVEVEVTSNNPFFNSGQRDFKLKTLSGSVIQSGRIYGNDSSNYIFNNIAAGNYIVEFYRSSSCKFYSEEITIEPYEQPVISPARGFVCVDSGTMTVSAVVNGGNEPYTFILKNAANNQIVATNNEAYFVDQDASLSYIIQVEDNCGNSVSTQVSVVSTGLGLDFQGSNCAAVGEDFPIYLRNFRGMTFTWTFPNGDTYTGNDPRSTIGAIDVNDYGTYRVMASTNDGCRTQELEINFVPCSTLAMNDINQTPQGVNVSGNLLTNDSDPQGDNFTVTSVSLADGTNVDIQPNGSTGVLTITGVGSINIFSNGNYDFVPLPDFIGQVPLISYTNTDSTGQTDSATLDIDVVPPNNLAGNQRPIANNDTNQTDQNVPVSGNLIDSNDKNPYVPQNELIVTEINIPGVGSVMVPENGSTGPQTIPGVGTIDVSSNGNYTFNPNTDYTGTTPEIGYTIKNSDETTNSANLVIHVNMDPHGTTNSTYANDDANLGPINMQLSGNVITNDNDPEGDVQTVTNVFDINGAPFTVDGTTENELPSGGNIVFNQDGTYVYTPANNFVGTEQVVYVVSDGDATYKATLYLTTLPECTVAPTINGESPKTPIGISTLNRNKESNWVTESNGGFIKLESRSLGFVPTRLSTTQRDDISNPEEGMVIYNTTTECLEFYTGTEWVCSRSKCKL